MIFKYGAYSHDINECGLRWITRSIFDKFNRVAGDVTTVIIGGVKQANSVANLTTALGNLETAYQVQGGNFGVYLDDGTTVTRHAKDNSATFGGIRVAGFEYPSNPSPFTQHTEYLNKRTYVAILTWAQRYGPSDALYAYRERITFIGTGGAKWAYIGSLTGTPVLQTLRQQTPVTVIQEGYVIGRGTRLAAPSALALGTEHLDQRRITESSPEDVRVGASELFRTDYRYIFEGLAVPSLSFTSHVIPAF